MDHGQMGKPLFLSDNILEGHQVYWGYGRRLKDHGIYFIDFGNLAHPFSICPVIYDQDPTVFWDYRTQYCFYGSRPRTTEQYGGVLLGIANETGNLGGTIFHQVAKLLLPWADIRNYLGQF